MEMFITALQVLVQILIAYFLIGKLLSCIIFFYNLYTIQVADSILSSFVFSSSQISDLALRFSGQIATR